VFGGMGESLVESIEEFLLDAVHESRLFSAGWIKILTQGANVVTNRTVDPRNREFRTKVSRD